MVWVFILLITPLLLQHIEGSIAPVVGLGVMMQLLVVLLPLLSKWGVARILIVVVVVASISWASEAIGVATGFPFGAYQYSDLLPYKLREVPLLIPMAWIMMLIPSWSVSYSLLDWEVQPASLTALDHLKASTWTGAAMVAWDFYVDPQMVSLGIWEWENPSGYFGTPLTNFFGWWMVAFLLTIIVRPSNLPRRPLLIVYTLTWALEFFGLGFIWGQAGPAFFGFFGMGIFVFLGWKKELEHSRSG